MFFKKLCRGKNITRGTYDVCVCFHEKHVGARTPQVVLTMFPMGDSQTLVRVRLFITDRLHFTKITLMHFNLMNSNDNDLYSNVNTNYVTCLCGNMNQQYPANTDSVMINSVLRILHILQL